MHFGPGRAESHCEHSFVDPRIPAIRRNCILSTHLCRSTEPGTRLPIPIKFSRQEIANAFKGLAVVSTLRLDSRWCDQSKRAPAEETAMTAGDLQRICIGSSAESQAACRFYVFGDYPGDFYGDQHCRWENTRRAPLCSGRSFPPRL